MKFNVLYPDPDPGLGKEINHGLLAGAIRPYEIGPRPFRRFSAEDHDKRVKNFLASLKDQLSAHNPELVILSSEYLWAVGYKQAWLEKLRDLLLDLGIHDVEFIGYVRGPSSHYLSLIQQRLKASSKFRPPSVYSVGRSADAYASFFAQSKVSVRLFDRGALKGGDIVVDFLSLYRPDLAQVVTQAAQRKSSNESISAEGMVLLQKFRKHFFAEKDDQFNKPTKAFVENLRLVEEKYGFPRPTLRPEVQEYADYSSDKPLQLRKQYGIVFPQLDYSRLEKGDFAKNPPVGNEVQDVVQVDNDRLKQMILSLLEDGRKIDPSVRDWLKQLQKESNATSAFSFLQNKLGTWRHRRHKT